jgi:hypothetical protein
MDGLSDGDGRLEDGATATQRRWSNVMVVNGMTVMDVATAMAMDGKWTACGQRDGNGRIVGGNVERWHVGWLATGWTDGIGQQWTMVAPCPEPQMKKRQHTTYCCLPLANNTRMNGAMEMAENREANYSDASLG